MIPVAVWQLGSGSELHFAFVEKNVDHPSIQFHIKCIKIFMTKKKHNHL